jgi:hypothetical protein
VKWSSTTAEYENRFDRYLDFNFFEHQASAVHRCRLLPPTHARTHTRKLACLRYGDLPLCVLTL